MNKFERGSAERRRVLGKRALAGAIAAVAVAGVFPANVPVFSGIFKAPATFAGSTCSSHTRSCANELRREAHKIAVRNAHQGILWRYTGLKNCAIMERQSERAQFRGSKEARRDLRLFLAGRIDHREYLKRCADRLQRAYFFEFIVRPTCEQHGYGIYGRIPSPNRSRNLGKIYRRFHGHK